MASKPKRKTVLGWTIELVPIKKGTVLFLKRVLITNLMAAYDPSLGNAFRVSLLGQFPHSCLL